MRPILVDLGCRIRHKKCDEASPACSQCSSTGRRCDFIQSDPNNKQIKSLHIALESRPGMILQLATPGVPQHMRNLTYAEASHFDYFRLVCARDFALCLENEMWENLLLRS